MFRLVRIYLLISTVMISSVGIMSPAPSPAIAAATTWYVATTGNDANSCSSPAQPCATIQAAVDKAANGDIVKVAVGTFVGTTENVVSIQQNLTLLGGWKSDFTNQISQSEVDGQETRNALIVHQNSKVLIDRFVIQNGYNSSGGGIVNSGVLTLTNSLIISNTAGMSCCSGGGGGAGIYNGGTLWLKNSTIAYNRLLGGFTGAGIYNQSVMHITNSSVLHNQNGEGIYNQFGQVTVNNSTLYKNSRSALVTSSGTITYTNSLLFQNGLESGSGECLNNSGTFVSGGYNLITSFDSPYPWVDCSPISTDLESSHAGIFEYATPPKYVLTPNSLAIDMGNPSGCKDYNGTPLTQDQNSAPRSLDGNSDTVARCDIGAIEFNPATNNIQSVFLPLATRNYCPNFLDDFSQNRGWFTIDSSLRRVELLNGEYRSLSKQSGYLFLYRAPICPRENYTVEVDTRWAQIGSNIGLIFGDTGDYSNFYLFDINTDYQAFILLRYRGGAYTTLAGPTTQTGAINSGTQNNKLKVIRNGTAISLYINNIFLDTWYDGTIAGLTYVGLATSPYDNTPLSDARFDNFSVTGNYASGASLPSLEPNASGPVGRPLPAHINWQPPANFKFIEQP